MLDIQHYYAKMVNQEAIKEEEIVALLKELAHYRGATAFLASCQAATLESLPKSTSKSARGRHEQLCLTAAQLLDGDSSGIRYPTDLGTAKARCLSAASVGRTVQPAN